MAVDRDVLNHFSLGKVVVCVCNFDGDGGGIEGARGGAKVFDDYFAHAGDGVAGAVALGQR